MNQSPFIYLRGLKHTAFTVFCVADGQKNYYDPQFGIYVPYSSGQQVKRSVLEKLCDDLNVAPSPVTFYFDLSSKGELGEGEAVSACNPLYIDQLIGGWMKAKSNKKGKKQDDEDKTVVKRRSPLSISAMTPLHPLLASMPKENVSFDRTDRPSIHKVVVRDPNGKPLTEEQIEDLLKGQPRSRLRKWIPKDNNGRAIGLFTYDVAIDLRRLFCVSTSLIEPELSTETMEKLKVDGWKPGHNVFGECLVLPKEKRDKVIPALADALIDWHITSNQARTFSLMETLAVAISDNANTLAAAIHAKLIDDSGNKPSAKPIIDEKAGAKTFITLPCSSYVVTESESADALDKAKQELIDRMMAFDYENQQ